MRRCIAIAAATLLAVTPVKAADLTLLVGGSMTTVFQQVGDAFAHSTGNRIAYIFDTTGELQKHLRSGEPADIILVSAQGMDQLDHDHLILPGSQTEIAIAKIGVSVRRGAAHPDLSTAEAFKRAMLAGHSIAMVNPKAGGTSGIYLDTLFQRLGIADEIKKKAVWANQGFEVAAAVGSGKAELGLTFISEMLPNKTVEIAGTLPDPIQSPTVYVVAIPVSSMHQREARAFLGVVSSPSTWPVIVKAGLTPVKK
ncbi:MAG TPA: molybdate ABC transporter substrate-binding protein [Micropepsaceae bacterium]|nr:molybdate ABC transporter substrate-binding protein [Micropepsaceae bacterium]